MLFAKVEYLCYIFQHPTRGLEIPTPLLRVGAFGVTMCLLDCDCPSCQHWQLKFLVLDFLKSYRCLSGCTARKLAQEFGMTEKKVTNILNELTVEGKLCKDSNMCKDSKKGRWYLE